MCPQYNYGPSEESYFLKQYSVPLHDLEIRCIEYFDWLCDLVKSFYNYLMEWSSYCLEIFIQYVKNFSFGSGPNLTKTSKQNFAESSAGANILFASKSIINKKAILDSSNEVYLILPDCGATYNLPQEELPNVIVNLSDDVVVESIEVSNHEDFSASLSEITVYGSIDYPPSKWVQLGTI